MPRLEVLIAISRFWAQRVSWSGEKNKYELLEITGPDEYAHTGNNNWYTATIAAWTLTYTLQAVEQVKQSASTEYEQLKQILKFDEEKETGTWQAIINNLYYPADEEKGIFLQQDDYLDKVPSLLKDLDSSQQPINQHWTQDQMANAGLIQQADALLGFYLFKDHYDRATIRRNFDFYEPRTLHESALSPGVHAVLAANIGDEERAYAYFLQSARYHLDNYNNDTQAGCHIPGMAGTWHAMVKGFGGMRVLKEQLHLHPFIPQQWQSYTFKIRFRGHLLDITVTQNTVKILNQSDKPLQFYLYNQAENIPANNIASFARLTKPA